MSNSRLLVLASVILLAVNQRNCQVLAATNLALLSGTLRTFQQAGCDDDVVTLKCPPGTSISVELAQYGKSAHSKHLCPPKATSSSVTPAVANISCLWPTALQNKWDAMTQGTWGRTVVEACQKKSNCKFQASPKTFEGDPCPGERKYVEVAYKCRPYEFRSRVACENERIQLQCNPNSRVAIYSASYGRTEYESFQCPQPQGVSEETCLVSYATETVMQICHGKRRCEFSADASTFGNPCRPQTRMYLRVVYTCVPRKVLNKQYEGKLEEDEADLDLNVNYDQDDFDSYDSANEHIRESAASPPAPNIEPIGKSDNLTNDQLNPTRTKLPPHSKSETTFSKAKSKPRLVLTTTTITNPFRLTPPMVGHEPSLVDPNCTVVVVTTADDRERVIGFISAWINTYTYIAQNQERFYLYLILSVGAGVLLCLTLLASRLLVQKRRAHREAKFRATNVGDGHVAHGFVVDDISEVDADIDLTTPLPVPHVAIHSPKVGNVSEVVRYPYAHAHTLRRDVGTNVSATDSELPRSLSSGTGNSMYYYG